MNISIIMQSAYVMERDKKASKSAGSDGFIEKPIQKKVLYNVITKYLS